ncbi:DUF3667 domain-containing protein [Aquimarina muelleri]|uniref:DUF3667 domain-containing protein n=1 Tax=Aquimarina muelleri TaxID=279356 RepID=UPI000420F116|nr:DUF3667 domain-containing protein [Aquimarina muelleri]MCX2763877.1 DUF3667 domain-containing protein [Aquimarina muelleri]
MSDLITITNCKNCGNQIETYNFCPSCGVKKITNRITFKNLVSEFVDRFFNLDNSFIKTFIHLFTKPDEVIDGYIHGLRKRYVNAFGYFAISITITGFYAFLVKDRLKEIIKFGNFSEQQAKMQSSLFDSTFQHQSIISFLLIPLLAILSRLVFLNYKKYNLTEHFVIYLYAYSHIVGTMALVLLPLMFIVNDFIIIMLIQFPVYIFYMAYVLKKLYQISVKKIMIKTLLFLIYVSILYIITIILATALMIMSGTISIPSK